MLNSIFEAENMRKFSLLIFVLCILISLKNQNAETKKGSSSISAYWSSSSWDLYPSMFLSIEDEEEGLPQRSLEYDFYRTSCPQAENIIREVIREIYKVRSSVAPEILRLAFHDCFIEGCDASVLLDSAEDLKSEKDSAPNESLKGFDTIDIIKSQVEEVCPGVVSCADIVVLAAREGVVQAGGPFYPLLTGRRDSFRSFPDIATYELPSPLADLSETLASFSSRGFDERETVTLLGAHSIGTIHCKFFESRLYNFGGTNKPDPSMDPQFLNQMRSRCNNSDAPGSPAASPSSDAPEPSSLVPPASFDSPESSSTASSPSYDGSPSPSSEKPGRMGAMSSVAAPSIFPQRSLSFSPSSSRKSTVSYEGSLQSSMEDPGVPMTYEGPGIDFGSVYYHRLLQGRGILYADQQLMSGEETRIWVKAYASDVTLFRRDFAQAMIKLSDLHVLTGSAGQVRFNCSRVA
ncbi:hypothetical protein MANES_11G044766v8 [Manihot esculenta]|uniref:Uncharacterized protein n=1 Tax=Manihot esculenta TaxID=3983 RepID=A0ACB7GTP2_MANES|nr:hypothetical protein MANES_11G044766v8 [Manihot esculenta]